MAAAAAAAVNRIVRILFESARMQARLVLHHPILPVGTVIQPAAFLLIVLSRDHPATRAQTTSILIAVVLTSLWGASLWTSGSILRREIADGTLARSMTSLSDARLVVIGKCAGATVVTFGLLLVTAVAMAAVLRVGIGLGDLADVFVGLVLVAVSGIALGYLFSGIFVVTRYAQHWTAALTYPVYILAGLMIPVAMLPAVARWPSWLISLYWAHRFLAAAADGDFDASSLAAALALTAVYAIAGGIVFMRLIDQARRKGTLDLV